MRTRLRKEERARVRTEQAEATLRERMQTFYEEARVVMEVKDEKPAPSRFFRDAPPAPESGQVPSLRLSASPSFGKRESIDILEPMRRRLKGVLDWGASTFNGNDKGLQKS
eukprot:scaffold79_cov259-Pinguiococcus_pyrenoidosus.AAC.32